MLERYVVIYKKLIAVGCFKEPKYKTWFKKESWTAIEAVCLFNGIDIHSSSQIKTKTHPIDFPGTKTVITGMKFISYEDNKRYNLNGAELWIANEFLDTINKEENSILLWKDCLMPWEKYLKPLPLTKSYMQRVITGHIPRKLLKFVWDLYKKRNDNDFNKNNWERHEKIFKPFLQLIADKENALLKYESAPPETDKTINKEHVVKQDKEKIKIILEESARAREKRVRNRGLEIYKDFKEKYPNKKITKEDVAKQIMQEEASSYEFISKEQPLKKQPVLGTYLKELRRGL